MADGITIYAPNSTENVLYEMDTIYEGCLEKCTLMQEDYIELHFNVAEPIFFPIGSKCTWNGKEYYVTEAQQPSYDEATGGYRYELKMEAYYRAWKLKIFKYYPDVENGTRETEFSLTAKLKDQVEMLVRCLNKDGFRCNGQEFEAKVDDTNAYFDENNVMTYSSVNYLDALSQISEKWDCEWWVIGNVLYVGKCESKKDGFVDINGDELTDFILGDNVVSMDGSKSQTDYATRLYAFGSDTNLPKNYGKGDAIFQYEKSYKRVDHYLYKKINRSLYTSYFNKGDNIPNRDPVFTFEKVILNTLLNTDTGLTGISYWNGNQTSSKIVLGSDTYKSIPLIVDGNKSNKTFGVNLDFSCFAMVSETRIFDVGVAVLLCGDKDGKSQSVSFFSGLYKKDVENVISQAFYINERRVTIQRKSTTQTTVNKSVYLGDVTIPDFTLTDEQNITIRVELCIRYTGSTTNTIYFGLSTANSKFIETLTYDRNSQEMFTRVRLQYLEGKLDGKKEEAVLVTNGKYKDDLGFCYLKFDTSKYLGIAWKREEGQQFLITNIVKSKLPSYYFRSERDIQNSDTIKAMAEKRLSLPSPYYIDSEEGLPLDNIVEKVVTYDDEYPKANSAIDIVEAKHNKYIEDEEQTDITYNEYYIHTNKFTFDSDYMLDTADKLEVKFNTGALAGLTFETIFNPSDVTFETIKDHQAFKVVRQQFDGGLYLPNDAMHPEVGDEFVLLGWDASRIEDLGLINEAQEHLKKRAELELKNMNVDPTTYECTMFSDYIYGRAEPTVIVDDNGNVVTDERGVAIRTDDSQHGLDKTKSNIFQIGQRVKLHSKAFFKEGYRDSRIIGYERKMDIPWDSPVYSVGEKAVYSKINSFEKFMKQQQNNKK